MKRTIKCSRCRGTGTLGCGGKCRACDGTGKLYNLNEVKIWQKK